MSNMNQVMMLIVQLFLLSMVKTSGATRDGCDGYYRQGVESYLNCQIYLMKWTVAAYWLIAIGVLIFAFTVSRISYKEKIISYILRLIFLIHHHVKIMIFCCNNLFVCMIQKLFTLLLEKLLSNKFEETSSRCQFGLSFLIKLCCGHFFF